eukprot:CAMPEP_0181298094 /NCGR_PEP_ID=MMETSP1101-20121128/5600_1 /TAXON_ID=46948 /ORGANISM="Rhodomonas abbreviata, Strain Caron Lab Isolate" /LENGTH=72 /DNA_ID=CAMNT_0023403095 /DNA_START=254 /DNA_END=472 /DNA_ORIENTATION=+
MTPKGGNLSIDVAVTLVSLSHVNRHAKLRVRRLLRRVVKDAAAGGLVASEGVLCARDLYPAVEDPDSKVIAD